MTRPRAQLSLVRYSWAAPCRSDLTDQTHRHVEDDLSASGHHVRGHGSSRSAPRVGSGYRPFQAQEAHYQTVEGALARRNLLRRQDRPGE